ncbi:hypothetical protein HK104_008469 [Borealophlyctis nickersoniae]|nr:hypothetical protein HK104_008469 [Borealophlyctis nickersoniae]
MRRLSLRKSTASLPPSGSTSSQGVGGSSDSNVEPTASPPSGTTPAETSTSRLNFPLRRRTQSAASTTSSIASVASSIVSGTSGSVTLAGPAAARSGGLTVNTSTLDFASLSPESVRTPSPITPKKLNSLQLAAYKGDVKKLKAIMGEKKRDVNKLDTFHRFTALHIAVEANQEECARALLAGVPAGSKAEREPLKKANPNMTNLEGRTPLMLAVMFSNVDMVRLLLDYGASVDNVDALECSALHYAILNNDIVSFNLIMAKNPKLNGIDKTGNPLLHHAIRLERLDMALELIKKGHHVNTLNKDNQSPLHLAVAHAMEPVVRLLLQNGADPTLRDASGKKPRECIDHNRYDQEIVDLLTLKEMAKEAREVIVTRSFLELSRDELVEKEPGPSSAPQEPLEETAIEEMMQIPAGGTRKQQNANRAADVEYERTKEKEKGKAKEIESGGPSDEKSEEDGNESPLDISSSSLDSTGLEEGDAPTDSALWSALGLPPEDREELRKKKRKPKKKEVDLRSSSLDDIHENDRDPLGRTESELTDNEDEEPPEAVTTGLSPGNGDEPGTTQPMAAPPPKAKRKSDDEVTSSDISDLTSDVLGGVELETELSDISYPSEPFADAGGDAVQPIPAVPTVAPQTPTPRADAVGPQHQPQPSPLEPQEDDISSDYLDESSGSDRQLPKTLEPRMVQTAQRPSNANDDELGLSNFAADIELETTTIPAVAVRIPVVAPTRVVGVGSALRGHTLPPIAAQSGQPAGKPAAAGLKTDESVGGASIKNSEDNSSHGMNKDSESKDAEDVGAAAEKPVPWHIVYTPAKIQPSEPPKPPSTAPSEPVRAIPSSKRTVREPRPRSTTSSVASSRQSSRERKGIPTSSSFRIERTEDMLAELKTLMDKYSGQEEVEDVVAVLANVVRNCRGMQMAIVRERSRWDEVWGLLKEFTQEGGKGQVSDGDDWDVSQLRSWIERVKQQKVEAETWQNRALKAEKDLTTARNELQDLAKQQQSSVKSGVDTERQLAAAKSDLTALQLKFDSLSNEAAKVPELKERVATLEKDLKVASQGSEAVHLRLKEALKEAAESRAHSQDLLAELQASKKKLELEATKQETLTRELKLLKQIVNDRQGTAVGHGESESEEESDIDPSVEPTQAYIRRLEKELIQLRRQLDNEMAARKSCEGTRDEVRTRSKAIADDVAALEEKLKAERETSLRHQESVASLSLDLERLRGERDRLEEAVKQGQNALKAKSKEVETEMEAREKAQNACIKLQGALDALREEQTADKAALESRNRQIESLREQMKDKAFNRLMSGGAVMEGSPAQGEPSQRPQSMGEDMITYYEHEIRLLTQQFEEEKELRLEREQEHQRLVESLTEFEANISELKNLYEQEVAAGKVRVETENQLRKELDTCRADLAAAQHRLYEQEVGAIRTRSTMQDLESRLSEHEQMLKKAQAELAAVQQENTRLKTDIAKRKKAETDLEERCAMLLQEKQSQSELAERFEKEAATANAELSATKKRLVTQEQSSVSKLKGLESAAEGAVEKVHRLEADLAELESNLDEAREKYDAQRKEFEKAQAASEKEIRASRNEVNRLQAEVKHLGEMMREKEEELEEANEKAESAALETAALAKRVTELQHVLEVEKKKTRKYQKSTGSVIDKLTASLGDLTGDRPGSIGSLSNLLGSTERTAAPDRSPALDVGTREGPEGISAVRESISKELQGLGARLSTAEEEVEKDLARVASLVDDLQSDPNLDTALQEMVLKVMHTERARVSEVRALLSQLRRDLATVRGQTEWDLDSLVDGARQASSRIGELDKKVADLKSTLSGLRVERANLQIEVKEKQTALEDAEQMRIELETRVSNLEAEVRMKTDELAQKRKVGQPADADQVLNRRIEELETRLRAQENDFHAELATLHEKLGAQNAAAESVRKERATLQARLKVVETELRDKQIELNQKRNTAAAVAQDKPAAAADSQLQTIQADADSLAKRFSETQAAKEALLSRAIQLEKDLQSAESRADAAEKRLNHQQAVTMDAQRRVEELESELKARQRDVQRTTSELDLARRDNRGEVELLRDEIAHMKRVVEASASRAAEAQDAYRKARAQISDLEIAFGKERDDLEQAVVMLRQAKAGVGVEKMRVVEQLKVKQGELERVVEELEGLQKAKMQWDVEKKLLGEQMAKKDGTIRNLGFEVATLQESRNQMEASRRDAESHAAKCEALLRQVQFDADVLRASKGQLEVERVKLQEEIEKRGTIIAKKEKDLEIVRREFTQVASQLATLQAAAELATGAETSVHGAVGAVGSRPGTPASFNLSSLSRLQLEYRHAVEKCSALESQLALERDSRADLERRSDRAKRLLEDEIGSLTKMRSQLEERISFLETQRRQSDIKVAELMDSLNNGMRSEGLASLRNRLRDTERALADAQDKLQMYESQRTTTPASVDSRNITTESASSTISALTHKLATLETANKKLRHLLQTQENKYKQAFNAQMSAIAARLDAQARERDKVKRAQARNQEELIKGYEQQIKSLVRELQGIKIGAVAAEGGGGGGDGNGLLEKLWRSNRALEKRVVELEGRLGNAGTSSKSRQKSALAGGEGTFGSTDKIGDMKVVMDHPIFRDDGLSLKKEKYVRTRSNSGNHSGVGEDGGNVRGRSLSRERLGRSVLTVSRVAGV